MFKEHKFWRVNWIVKFRTLFVFILEIASTSWTFYFICPFPPPPQTPHPPTVIISCATVLNLGKHDLGVCLLKKTLLGTFCRSAAGEMGLARGLLCHGQLKDYAVASVPNKTSANRKVNSENLSRRVKAQSKVPYLGQSLWWLRLVLELLQEVVAQLYYSWKPQVPFSLQHRPSAASDSRDGQSQDKCPTPPQDIVWNPAHWHSACI